MIVVLATRLARTDPALTYYERMHERLRGAGLSPEDSARFLFAIDDYCIGAALNTETDVEINDRHDKFPLTAEAVEAGRPADHHHATLRLLLNGLIATVEIPATTGWPSRHPAPASIATESLRGSPRLVCPGDRAVNALDSDRCGHRLGGEPPPPLQGMEDHWQGGERNTSRKNTPNGDNRRAIGWRRSEVDACIASQSRATEAPDGRRRDPVAF